MASELHMSRKNFATGITSSRRREPPNKPMFDRISTRVSIVLVVLALGLLSLGVVAIAGRIYRDHALDNERGALVERLRTGMDFLGPLADEQARRMAARLTEIPSDNTAPSFERTELSRRIAQLVGRDSVYPATPERVAVYDTQFNLLAQHGIADSQSPRFLGVTCEQLRTQAAKVQRGEASWQVSFSAYCATETGLYYAVLVPLQHVPLHYAEVTFDLRKLTALLERNISLPLRLIDAKGNTVYESKFWPQDENYDDRLVVSLPIDMRVEKPALLQVLKDESSLYGRLEQTRYAVFLASGAITLLFVLIAIALLERTVIGPLHSLIGQLRLLSGDESKLGDRIRAEGNAESAKLADTFNAMTEKLERMYEQLGRMAFTDSLTQLPNRNFFQKRLEQAVQQARQESKSFGLFIVDLDRFRGINDTIGHHVGDLLLQQVAVRLRDKLRDSDTIARIGGDEFAVLLPNVTAKQADMAARMLIQSLRSDFAVQTHRLDVGASVGIALYPDHGVDARTLIQRAEVAMYAAKQAGCGQMAYDARMDRYHSQQLALMGELRHAVEQEQFVLYYQPKIGLKHNRVIGVEALVRWRHPNGTLIMPETFIPLLEQTSLMRGLTGWVTHEALRMASELRECGFELPVAVNISARDLQNSGLAEELAEHLAVYGASAQWLELEITESAVMADVAGAQAVLSQLAEMGFSMSIDDFGTGYSSLGYLKRLPVQGVKIDKSFVMGMAKDDNDAAIVFTSIDLTHNLGLYAVAEGVDEEGVLNRLRARGCDAAQGMYLSRPLPGTELIDWLGRSRWGLPAKAVC